MLAARPSRSGAAAVAYMGCPSHLVLWGTECGSLSVGCGARSDCVRVGCEPTVFGRYARVVELCLLWFVAALVCHYASFALSFLSLTSTKAGEFKTKLKINHWRSSPGPPELAGFYVDSVWVAGARA